MNKPDSYNNFQYYKHHQMLEQKSKGKELLNLEIKESKIMKSGKGVFTKIDIPKGSTITYYSPEYIFTNECIYTHDKIIKEKDKILEIFNKYEDYVIRHYKTLVIGSDMYISPDYVGHLLNDKGYKFGKRYKPELNNCMFDQLKLVSTRDIKKGEELYVNYGTEYWYQTLSGKNESRNDIIKKSKQKLK